MAKKKMKYTKEELNAMKIQAMLNGVDPSTIMNEEVETDIDIEIEEDNDKKKTKKKRKVSKLNVVGTENQTFTTKQTYLETKEKYKKLPQSVGMKVVFNEHDIHYKEQHWPIPERVVEYNLELIKIPKVAKDVAEKMSNGDKEEIEKAYNGDVRYYQIVTYENVLAVVSKIGYIRVENKDKKFSVSAKVLEKTLKQYKVNSNRVKKNAVKLLSEAIKNG